MPSKVPYKIKPGDSIFVNVMGTIIDQPLQGVYQVEPMGTVPMGPAYGRAQVQGLTLEEAENSITRKLDEILAKPDVQVTAAGSATEWREGESPTASYTIKPGDRLFVYVQGTIMDQPIHGVYQVEPTGTVALGPAYGRVKVEGLTMGGAQMAIEKKLAEILAKTEVEVTFGGWLTDDEIQRLVQLHAQRQEQARAAAEKAQQQAEAQTHRGSGQPSQKGKDTKK